MEASGNLPSILREYLVHYLLGFPSLTSLGLRRHQGSDHIYNQTPTIVFERTTFPECCQHILTLPLHYYAIVVEA